MRDISVTIAAEEIREIQATLPADADREINTTVTGGADRDISVIGVAEIGDPGAAATVAVGTVTTVAHDQPAEVTNVGDGTHAVFDFQIPRGEDGVGAPPLTQNFPTDSTEWLVEHNLGVRPVVVMYDSHGKPVEGRVEENDEVHTLVSWYYPQSGSLELFA